MSEKKPQEKELTSLDAMQLFCIARGVNTLYAITQQVGLSVGACRPSLKRLEEGRYITGKQIAGKTTEKLTYKITDVGKKALRKWADSEIQISAARDVEDIARILVLLHRKNNAKDVARVAGKILASWEALSATTGPRPRTLPTIKLYRALVHRFKEARRQADRKVLEEIATPLGWRNFFFSTLFGKAGPKGH